MKQKFILEKEDMETLKKGEPIYLAFAGGKIEICAETKMSRSKQPDGSSHKDRAAILEYIQAAREPVKMIQVSRALGMENTRVHWISRYLAKARLIVNSGQGWRAVHETSAVSNKKKALSNGH